MPDNVSVCGECGFAAHYCDCFTRNKPQPVRPHASGNGGKWVEPIEWDDQEGKTNEQK